MDLFMRQGVDDLLDDGGIGTGRREHKLADGQPRAFRPSLLLVLSSLLPVLSGALRHCRRERNGISQLIFPAIYELLGHLVVVALGIALGQVLGEDVVAGGGQAVAAHAAVVAVLVGGLSRRREADDDVARTDVGIVYDVAAAHAARDGGVDDDGAHQVAHVGRLAAGGPDADAHASHAGKEVVGALNDGRNDLAGDEQLVAPDGRRNEDVVRRSDAEQVVGVHHDGVLCDAAPYGEVARLAPVHVGEA